MNNLQHRALGSDGGAGISEGQFQFPAIGAFKRASETPVKRQAASFAERWLYKFHSVPAVHAHKPFLNRRALIAADLTNLRIKKAQPGIKPAFQTWYPG